MSGTRLGLHALLLLLALGYFASAGAGPDNDLPDPFPIQRVDVTPEKLAQELKAHKDTVFVELSRKSFEEKVRAAAQAVQEARTPPRIIEAHYRAVFDPAGLRGTAQWKVVSTASKPAVLPLQSLNLAVANPRIDNANAVIGDFDGTSPGLLVEKKGEHVVTMDWTSRVEARPGGYQVEIETPRTPVCDLEIYLPRDHEIGEATDGCVVTGPHPSDRADLFLWRVVFAQVSPLHIVIRRSSDPQSPHPLVESQLHTDLDIEPDLVEAAFDFDLKVLHRGVRQLCVVVDPPLGALSVSLPGMESYTIVANPEVGPPTPGVPQVLLIQLREELRSGTLRISGRTRLPFGSTGRIDTWTAPAAAIVGDAVQSESLTVRASPEVAVENWQSRAFALNRISSTKEGGQQFALSGGLLDSGPSARTSTRPTARLVRAPLDYFVRQQTLWQLGSQGSTLLSRLAIEVNRGRVQQIPLQLPPGWEVDQVDAAPDDVLSHWRVLSEGNASVLQVMFKHLLVAAAPGVEPDTSRPASSARLTVRLRPTPRLKLDVPPAGVATPLPDLVPLTARGREGGFGIEYDKTLIDVTIAPPPALVGGDRSNPPAEEDCPWGKQLPTIYLPFRGEPYVGSLKVEPRGQQLRASVSSDVFLDATAVATARKLVVQARLSLRPDQGKTDNVELSLSAPLAQDSEIRDWKTDDSRVRIQKVERLTEQGDRWRIRFAQPLTASQPVIVSFSIVGTLPADSCAVPLPMIEGVSATEGQAKIFLYGVNVGTVDSEGLTDSSGSGTRAASGSAPWHEFHYSSAPVRLVLKELVVTPDQPTQVGAENVSLATYVQPSGLLEHHYSFTIWSSHLQSLPVGVTLPENARLLAVAVDGRWSTDLKALAPSDTDLSLPVAPVSGQMPASHCYEVVYTTEGGHTGLWCRLSARTPELSVQGSTCGQTWYLPPTMVPLRPDRLKRSPANSDGWTAWDELDVGEESSLLVLRSGGLNFAGIAIAAVLLLAFCATIRPFKSATGAGRRPLPSLAALATCVVVTALGTILLPSPLRPLALWPLSAACLVAVVWIAGILVARARAATFRTGRSTMVDSSVSAVLIAIATALVCTTRSAHGEQGSSEPRSATVYMVTEGSGSTAREAAVASQELLNQLDELAHAVPPGLRGVVLQSADYSGEVRDGDAVFRATFKAQCFRDDDKSAPLTIPLSDVELADDQVLLDGAKVAPIAVGRPPTAWQFLVKGAGPHTVELQFTVPVHRDQLESEVDFQIPPLLQSQLTFTAPSGSYYLGARGTKAPARGRQKADYFAGCADAVRLVGTGPWGSLATLAALGPHSQQPPVLHADLGRLVSPLRVRWQQTGDTPQIQDVRLHEAYLWTLRPTTANLSAFLRYDVREGSLGEMVFELPPNLAVESIEGTILPDHLPLRLRDWWIRETGSARLLEIELLRPIHGAIELELHLVRSAIPGGVLDLSAPMPVLPGKAADDAKADRLLAYELDGLDGKLLELRQAVRVDAARFRPFGNGSAKGSTAGDQPHEVFSFRRRQGDYTVARLQLQPAMPDVTASQDITWHVAAEFADFRAVCKLEAKAGDLCLAEWDLPLSLQVTRVAGKGVLSWSRTGTRLQVCLDHAAETTIVVTGWQKHDAGQPLQFNVAGIRLLGPRAPQSTVRVIPGAGLVLERIGTGPAPRRLPAPDLPEWEYHYQQVLPRAAFSVRPAAPPEKP